MTLHPTTFLYLKPNDQQMDKMDAVREAFTAFAMLLQQALPDGPDKHHVMRLIRTAGMWSHVSITRHSDGSPRE